MALGNSFAASYSKYREALEVINGPKGCSPKDYGQYLQNKRDRQKSTAKPLKRGMRK